MTFLGGTVTRAVTKAYSPDTPMTVAGGRRYSQFSIIYQILKSYTAPGETPEWLSAR
jgi:hypothetical protein